MDNISYHYYKSIFKKYNKNFCDPAVSWAVAKKAFGWKFDLWHSSKSFMVILLCFGIILYDPIINWWVDLIIYGFVWNMTFNLFFNHLLNIKKKKNNPY